MPAYAHILKDKGYKYAYIDAFAGPGYRVRKSKQTGQVEGLWDDDPDERGKRFTEGSAIVAMESEPPFQSYIFIERDAVALKKLEGVLRRMGVSVENSDYVRRIDHLRRAAARAKFLSLEPLIGPIPNLDLHNIHWVIVGGESGPGSRPMDPGSVREIRDQCVDARVAFFFKQWGSVFKKHAGRRANALEMNTHCRPRPKREQRSI